MLKRIFLIVIILAYSSTLIHNFIPHHHHEKQDHHHHTQGHHHHEDHEDSNDLSELLADFTHHPAAKFFVPTTATDSDTKGKSVVVFLPPVSLSFCTIQLVEFDHPPHPPDLPVASASTSSLLRAPPLA